MKIRDRLMTTVHPDGLIDVRTQKDEKTDYTFDDVDEIMGSTTTLAERLPHLNGDDIFEEYNQYTRRRSKQACTLFQAVTAITGYRNYKFTEPEWNDLRAYAQKNYAYKPNKGHFTRTGATCVTKRRNAKYPDKKMMYFAEKIDSQNVKTALSKRIMVSFSYRGNWKYNRDYQGDLRLDNTYFGSTTYGHTLPFRIRFKGDDGRFYYQTVDSYGGRAHNKYDVPESNIQDLVKNKVFYSNTYIYVPEGVVTDHQIRPELLRLVLGRKKANSLTWDNITKFNPESDKEREVIEGIKKSAHEENTFIRSHI